MKAFVIGQEVLYFDQCSKQDIEATIVDRYAYSVYTIQKKENRCKISRVDISLLSDMPEGK